MWILDIVPTRPLGRGLHIAADISGCIEQGGTHECRFESSGCGEPSTAAGPPRGSADSPRTVPPVGGAAGAAAERCRPLCTPGLPPSAGMVHNSWRLPGARAVHAGHAAAAGPTYDRP